MNSQSDNTSKDRPVDEQVDNPAAILRQYQLACEYDDRGITTEQALIKLDEFYTNKFLEATKKVDRFEVIDDTGRAYVKGSIYGSPVSVELSYQDDDRTLKVFITAIKNLNKAQLTKDKEE